MHERLPAGGAPSATDPPRLPGTRVSIQNVRRTFPNGVVALDDVSLAIEPAEFVAVLGPSGSGKSTLLRLIAGLDQPQGGTVRKDEVGRMKDEGRAGHRSSFSLQPSSLAYVFQDAHLLPWRNVLHNVALPLELQRVPRPQRLDRARHAIEQVALSDAITRYPAQLSGGMRMRASLARALVTDPSLFLLDEPFAALDEITRHRLDEQLRDLWTRRRMTVVFVTHSINEAVFLADRAVVLSRRPARVVLDHRIDLPAERTEELRTTAAFAREAYALHVALRGEEP
jgi:NitT/TauT family transport system ATP-binding protein